MQSLDINPFTEGQAFSDEVIAQISQLMSDGDTTITVHGKPVNLSTREQVIRDTAKYIIDAAGLPIKQSEGVLQELILPDGRKFLVHNDVKNIYEEFISTYTPVGTALSDRRASNLWDLTRRQFQESDKLDRKAAAEQSILINLNAPSKKPGDTYARNLYPDLNAIINKTLDKFQGKRLNFTDIYNDLGGPLFNDIVFDELYENNLFVREAVDFDLNRKMQTGEITASKIEITNNIARTAYTDAEKINLLDRIYGDVYFAKYSVSMSEYDEFIKTSPGYVERAKQLSMAAVGMFIENIFALAEGLVSAENKAVRLWKQQVTSGVLVPNPGYYFANFIGGLSQLQLGQGLGGVLSVFSAVARSPRIYSAVMYNTTFGARTKRLENTVLISKDGMMYTPNMISNMMTEYSVGSAFVTAELGRQIQDDILGSEMWRNATGLGKGVRASTRAFTNLHSKVYMGFAESLDNVYRTGMFIEQLEQGVQPSIAAKEVRRVMFDYTDLTDFERNGLRTVFGFYSFMRKNTGLIMYELGKNPQRVRGQLRFIQQSINANVEEGYEEYAVSEYYHERLALLPGSVISNIVSNDYGAYTVTINNMCNHVQIYENATAKVYDQYKRQTYDEVLLGYLNEQYPNQNIVDPRLRQRAQYEDFLVDLANKNNITDLDMAYALGYTKLLDNGARAIDVRKFVDEYNLIRYEQDNNIGTYELYSDVYQSKMYIFPLLNAPDGFNFAINILGTVFGGRLATPEMAEGTISLINPIYTAPFEVMSGKAVFGNRELQKSRLIPAELVDDPIMSHFFQINTPSTNSMFVADNGFSFFPKVRLKAPSKTRASSASRMYSYSGQMYEYESERDALLHLHYMNLAGFIPGFGRSERQYLLGMEAFTKGEFTIPAGMTHSEYFLEIMGLRNVPIKSLDEQIAQGIYEYYDRLKEFDQGYVEDSKLFILDSGERERDRQFKINQ